MDRSLGECGFKTEHVPLRGDRDYPPGVLMVVDDITELTRERRISEQRMRQLINTLVDVVDRRDPLSVNYSSRVAKVARAIAGEMESSEEDVKTVDIAGSLMNLYQRREFLTRRGFPFCSGCDSRVAKEIRHVSMHCSSG